MTIQGSEQEQTETQQRVFADGPSMWSRLAGTLCSGAWPIRIAAILLFGLYVRSIGFAPVYDDNIISPWSRLSDIPMFFTHDIFGVGSTAHSVYYRPLAMTYGFLLTYVTGGAPGFLHLGAIFLHLAAVFLAYLFGRHLFHDDRLAMLTALLFGLHPSKVESVAWIGSSCVDGLGALFFFGSLLTFLKWRESKAGRWLAASVAVFACAMFTKETMVFVPVLIAIYLWLTTPSVGRVWRTLRTLLPYGVVWVVYMAIRHQVIKPPTANAEYIHPTFTLANLWTAPCVIWWYVRHLLFPWGLAVEYTSRIIDRPTLHGFVLPGIGVLLSIAAGVWLWSRSRSPVAAFLMFWFAITLAPPVIVAPMVSEHDRYLYIPAYAFCALVAWSILYLGRFAPSVRTVVALCLVLLWSGLTWHEMGYWDCDELLWARVLQFSPSHPKALMQMAHVYVEKGDIPKALSTLDDAMRYYPNSPKVWLERAGILFEDKKIEDARAAYLKAIQATKPAVVTKGGLHAHVRAAAAYQLALMDLSTNNYVEAESYARMALSTGEDGVGYHATLSRCLVGQGRMDEAKAENQIELDLRMNSRRSTAVRP